MSNLPKQFGVKDHLEVQDETISDCQTEWERGALSVVVMIGNENSMPRIVRQRAIVCGTLITWLL